MNWVIPLFLLQHLTRTFSQFIGGYGDPGKSLALGLAGGAVVGAMAFGVGALWAYFRRTPAGVAKLAPAVTSPTVDPEQRQGGSTENIAVNESIDAANSPAPQEQFWASALAELESPLRRSGLWARAFSEANGSEDVAKANYLRYRAHEMAREHSAR